MSRQRVWFAADALFTSDPKIAELGDTFGPGGPLAVFVLHGLAKLQNDGGEVRTLWGALARYAFLSRDDARKIIETAARLDALELLGQTDEGFHARFPHWDRWQRSNDALRKSRSRDADEKETDEEKHQITLVFTAWQLVMDGAKAKLTKQRRACVRARLRAGYSLDDILRAVDGCAGSDFHMARGDWTGEATYNDLTLICRNDQKLEEFMARPTSTQGPAPDDEDPEAMYE